MKFTPDYTVIYSDDDIVVLNKRSGYLIASDKYDTESPRLDEKAEKEFGKLYAVHRIDKDASGLVIYARSESTCKKISQQFDNHEIENVYHVLIHGRPMWDDTQVSMKLLTDSDARHRTVANAKYGKMCVTDFHYFGSCGQLSWLEARVSTERTHQIRVHLQNSGFSVVCDPLYSGNQKPIYLSEIKRSWNGDEETERPLLNRLGLHSYQLTITHPVKNEKMTFTAPYQKDMDALRKQLAKIFDVDPLK